MEFVVRRQLLLHTQTLAGLYAGNPKRATVRPSTEQLLLAFGHINLYRYRDGTTEITPLNSLQRQILALMNVRHWFSLTGGHKSYQKGVPDFCS